MCFLSPNYASLTEELQKYEKLEIEVKQLIGMNFECLRELFAAGYTLTPPEPRKSMVELAENDSLTCTYNGNPLAIGERIPNTSLTFVRAILRRRGEFRCDCGNLKAYNLRDVERGERKTCGCGRYKRSKRKVNRK